MSHDDDEKHSPVGAPPPQAKDPHTPPVYPPLDGAPQYVQQPLPPNQEMGCFEKWSTLPANSSKDCPMMK
ncbi:hypothetical protein VIGAN_01360100 [Vigna angularis var. angularis]|uniref:Uncharacterized protein n=1 Tax=Vigna angularis var. angularis TaxID=157739 RepID=A0A0S3R551_PHAAN|nr:hypothetical protein VIGAN_01360100 [Vigna angularis var. angularis]